jgi:hypothetical protein
MRLFCKEAISPKTACMATYLKYAQHTLSNLETLMKFFVVQRRYRRMRWDTYIARQRGVSRLATDIIGSTGVNKRVLIGHGDRGMGHTRGCAPMGNKRLMRELKQRTTFVLVQEDYTSKNCCACYQQMHGKKIYVEGEVYNSYKTRLCDQTVCARSYWNRDVSDSLLVQHNQMRLCCTHGNFFHSHLYVSYS